MKDCPRCKLINPDTALRCDCGYDFPSGTMQRPYFTKERKVGVLGAAAALFYLAWRLIAVGVASQAGRDRLGWVMLFSLIVALILFLVYRWRTSRREDSN